MLANFLVKENAKFQYYYRCSYSYLIIFKLWDLALIIDWASILYIIDIKNNQQFHEWKLQKEI